MERVLNSPEDTLTSVDSHYFAFMLYKRAQHYGANRNERLMDSISQQVTSHWLANLNEKKFSMTEGVGDDKRDLSPVQVARVAEMLASLMVRSGLKDSIETKLGSVFKKLTTSALYKPAEGAAFFMTKALGESLDFTAVVEFNLLLRTALKEYNKHATNSVSLPLDQVRQFFSQQVALASKQDIAKLFFALRGLKSLSEELPFLVTQTGTFTPE